ncbi:hypothetical protein FBF27_03895 [Candidatus Saccharibacteria bacterium oral taxon 488]|nr:hypothetical protein FBF27_03895 [Candidatus Saccharibacteria bacterium oral taxon 488]
MMVDKYRETPDRPALDPTLESELREGYVSADKMGQVVAKLRKEAPDTFDVASQMAEALRIALNEYEDPKEGWKSRERSDRIFAVFDVMTKYATPEELEQLLVSDAFTRLGSEWRDGNLEILVKRYSRLGNVYGSKNPADDTKRLRLLTRYILGKTTDSEEVESSLPLQQSATKPNWYADSDRYPYRSYIMSIPVAESKIVNSLPSKEELRQLSSSSPRWSERFGLDEAWYNHDTQIKLVGNFHKAQLGRLSEWKAALEAGRYPDWFSSYVIDACPELGGFNSQTGVFDVREIGSKRLLPEVNPAALEAVYEILWKYRPDELEAAKFGELYGREVVIRTGLGQERRRETQGEWHEIICKYKDSSTPQKSTAEELQTLLEGQCTGWFPGGSDSIYDFLYKVALSSYDSFGHRNITKILVFTTGRYNIPRIMMCLGEGGDIKMILGIDGDDCRVESCMTDALHERISELSNGQDKLETIHTIKKIDEICAKQQKGEDLSLRDIMMLWFGADSSVGESYFWKNGGIATLQSVRGEHNFVEDVKTIVDQRGLAIDTLGELILDRYIDQAEKLKVFFYDRGVFFTRDERYQKHYGIDRLDIYRNLYGYGADSSCMDVINCLIKDGKGVELFREYKRFAEPLVKEMGGEFDDMFGGGRLVAGDSMEKEELYWGVEADFGKLAEEAREKKCLPGFIEFISLVKPPLGKFDINEFVSDLLSTEGTNIKIMCQLVGQFNNLKHVGLTSYSDQLIIWRLCELYGQIEHYQDKCLADVLSKRYDDEFWRDMPGSLGEYVRAIRAGIIRPPHGPVR